MNDEIKEILQRIKKHYVLNEAQDNLLLDYITNSQQEIKEANDSITWWTNRFKAVERDNRELKQENERLKENRDWWKDRFFGQQEYDDSHRITAIEYKKRIEKVVEYIKNDMPYLEEPDEEIERIDGSIYMTMKEYDKNIILNILQNGSEE